MFGCHNKRVAAFLIIVFCLIMTSCTKYEPIDIYVDDRQTGEISTPSGNAVVNSDNTVVTDLSNAEQSKAKQIEKSNNTKQIFVIAYDVNMREEPSFESRILGVLQFGEKVDAVNENDGWTAIRHGEKVCYVATKYLSPDEPSQEEQINHTTEVTLDPDWKFADFSEINSGTAVLYRAVKDRKNITIGLNAGHGTLGGTSVKTWCHPDKTPKTTGGTTAAGSEKAVAVSSGMNFNDGTSEANITLKEARFLKDVLLDMGYDVLMIRDGEDVQLDNVARTVICNNKADCHIAIHWDSDGLDYDKGCFYMSVPDGIKDMDPVASTWIKSEELGESLIDGLKSNNALIMGPGSMDLDLTQTSFSSIPSVDIELGNQCSNHSDDALKKLANGLADGISSFFKDKD